MTEEELKTRLIASGWKIHNICAIKYFDSPKEVLDKIMPELYAITKLDKYELFVGDVDNSITTDPGMVIFDYTCWNGYRSRNPDFARNAEILCTIESFIDANKYA